ncbi:hypothetical protein ADL21_11135 [Streptomyces albus subsp. albus]|nr:hypothetical protein ADL21_11135 [Streptomyces albus subsp. albus]
MAAFATPAELAAFLDDAGLDAARAGVVLDAVSDEIREAVGWSVTAETDMTVVLDGSGTPDLLLPTLYLTTVASVVENGVLVAASGYRTYQHGSLLRIVGDCPVAWTGRRQGVTVTYSHGYAPGAVPGVFKTVALEAAGRLADNPGFALKSRSVGQVAVSYTDARAALGPVNDPRLDAYRLPAGF